MSAIVNVNKSLHYLMQSLSEKERLYVEYRAKGGVPSASARVAGFSNPVKAAKELEENERVRAAIEYSIRAAYREAAITKHEVLGGFLDAIRNSTSAAEQIAGWREIAKLEGLYAPEKVDINVSIEEKVRQLPDDQLIKMAAMDGEFEVLEG